MNLRERERERGGERAGWGPVRVAWLSLLQAYVRAGRKHIDAAEVQAQAGRPDRAEAALRHMRTERKLYEHALAAHPEWADDAPEWPEPDPGSR
jgi:hypothetical protein